MPKPTIAPMGNSAFFAAHKAETGGMKHAGISCTKVVQGVTLSAAAASTVVSVLSLAVAFGLWRNDAPERATQWAVGLGGGSALAALGLASLAVLPSCCSCCKSDAQTTGVMSEDQLSVVRQEEIHQRVGARKEELKRAREATSGDDGLRATLLGLQGR